MMIRARIAFRDDQPDRELIGLREVRFTPDGDSQWRVFDAKKADMKTWTFRVGTIAYIQMGVY